MGVNVPEGALVADNLSTITTDYNVEAILSRAGRSTNRTFRLVHEEGGVFVVQSIYINGRDLFPRMKLKPVQTRRVTEMH